MKLSMIMFIIRHQGTHDCINHVGNAFHRKLSFFYKLYYPSSSLTMQTDMQLREKTNFSHTPRQSRNTFHVPAILKILRNNFLQTKMFKLRVISKIVNG